MPDDVEIESLERERESLRRHESSGSQMRPSTRRALKRFRVELDSLWDLLRQRRALRAAARTPDTARERPANTVERYWQ